VHCALKKQTPPLQINYFFHEMIFVMGMIHTAVFVM